MTLTIDFIISQLTMMGDDDVEFEYNDQSKQQLPPRNESVGRHKLPPPINLTVDLLTPKSIGAFVK